MAQWLGGIWCVLGMVILWLACEGALAFLSDYSLYYARGAALLIFVFTLGIGPLTGLYGKIKKGFENEVFLRDRLSLLLNDGLSCEKNRFQKLFYAGTVRYTAERVIAPLLIGAYLGADFLLAYAFLNSFAASDLSPECQGHGYASVALILNKIVTAPAYWLLFLVLRVYLWICQRKAPKAQGTFAQRCGALIQAAPKTSFSAEGMKGARWTLAAVVVLTLLLAAALYLFVNALLAAAGLDQYWNFWNGVRQ